MIKTLYERLLAAVSFWSPDIVYYPTVNWVKVVVFSLLVSLVLFLVWILSPLGIIFIASSLVQFLVSKKAVKIIAWIFQGLVFFFTLLIGIASIIFSFTLYGQDKYILLFGVIMAVTIISLLIIGTIIAQIIWQGRKPKQEK